MIYSKKIDISHQFILDVLHYDCNSGIFTWKKQLAPRGRVGSVAGNIDKRGRNSIRINGILYLAHRLAWFYMTGTEPINEIDHINRNQGDNRWINLREATRSENLRNTGIYKNNSSGEKGVRYRKDRNTWEARITLHRKIHILGQFKTFEDAVRIRLLANTNIHGSFSAKGI